MLLSPGARLGPYEILTPIGAGGMGEVYRARDQRLGRDVAIKVSAEQFGERFEREARAVAALNHTNICSLYDVGPNYLVMELVEGQTLAERIAEGPVPVEEALAIARQLTDALESAHERGIVHRDLKPANIKITPGGMVKVLDFGLAKMAEESSAAGKLENSPTLTLQQATRAGVILGTAAYMSPEQARGKTVDKRADIWAFGVVFYEMLTGKRLFEGETLTDTLAAVVREEPRWDRVPAKLRRLLRLCLERDPKQRLRDIGDVWKFLGDAPAPVAQRRPWPLWGAAALFLLTTSVLALVHFREPPVAAPLSLRFQIAAPEKSSFEIYLTLSPNGRRLAFSAAGSDGRVRLWVRDLDSLESRPLPGTENSGSVFWSPDSRLLAFGDGNKLKKIDASGGPAQTLCESPSTVGSGSWSPDGMILFGSRGAGPIMTVSAAGGIATAVTAIDQSRQETFHSFPSFLPDGRHFIYYRRSPLPDNVGIYVGSLDTRPEGQSHQRLLPSQFGAVYAPDPDGAASTNGRILFLSEGTLMAQPFDARKLELAGEPVRLAEKVGSTNQYGHFTASKNGVLAFKTGTSASQSELAWFDRQGKALTAFAEPVEYNMLSLSPDGTKAAVCRTSAQSGGGDIWLYDFSRGAGTRFTFDPANDIMPVWSPDGSRIVFSSAREGAYNLYQKISNGAGSEEALLKSSENKFAYDWSSDGRFLLYSVLDKTTGKFGIWALPLSGEGKPIPYLKTEFNQHQARFSPDSRWIAYSSDESGRNEIYVQPFPAPSGGKWMISKEGGTQPHWRRDGKEMFYISFDSKLMAIDVSATPVFQAGIPRVLFAAPILGGNAIGNVHRYDVTADGKRFLINTTGGAMNTSSSNPITIVLNWTTGLKK